MDPVDGRFKTPTSGSLLGLTALFGLVLCSCRGEPSTGGPRQGHLAAATDTVGVQNGSPEFAPIDSIFTIIDDLTGDGEADSLKLRVIGSSMESPFEWTARIWVRGELAFEHEAVDSLTDALFGDTESRAESYGLTGVREQDKTWYYLEELPRRLIDKAQFQATSAIFDANSPAGVSRTLSRELGERGLRDEQVLRGIIERAEERLKAGTVLLSIPRSPFQSEFPRIYVEEVGEFVPVFVW